MIWCLMALNIISTWFDSILSDVLSVTVYGGGHNLCTEWSWSWFGVNILKTMKEEAGQRHALTENVLKHTSTFITLTYVLLVSGHCLHCVLPCCEVSVCLTAKSPIGPKLDQDLRHPDGVKKLQTKQNTWLPRGYQYTIYTKFIHQQCQVWIHIVL